MIITLYSVLHMLVDGACALAMFGWFCDGTYGYLNILLYNFCAFAMQMPLGVLLDLGTIRIYKKKGSSDLAYIYVVTGVVLTIIGALTHPIVLGMGNALFHIGGGVDVIREDRVHQWNGQTLGLFVAPGALGLYLGSLLGKQADRHFQVSGLVIVSLMMLSLLGILYRSLWQSRNRRIMHSYIGNEMNEKENLDNSVVVCCVVVVILRSYIGMAVGFSWKTTVLMGLLSVLAVALGKAAGGILAARFDRRKVIAGSLILAGICYGFSNHVIFGIAALFFFNMTMPTTLYLLVERFIRLPGAVFGLLTFALFLGFLPVYYDIKLPISGPWIGMVGSVVSVGLLLAVERRARRK